MGPKKPTRKRRRQPSRQRGGARKPARAEEPRRGQPRREGGDDLIEEALERSPADETEIVLLDTRRAIASSHRDAGRTPPHRETTAFVRVLERGRLGAYRTGAADASGLERAIRQAIAQSRARDALPGLPHLPAAEGDGASDLVLLDPELVELEPEQAATRLRRHLRDREAATLTWGVSRVEVANSRGVRRRARVTDCTVLVRCARAPGGGRAAGSSRELAALDLDVILERARLRHGSGRPVDPPREKTSVLLAPEATVRLVALLNQTAFSAAAYQDGTSFLREHLGVQVFDRRLDLRDDGTDPAGLPFPFDFEGTPKKPVDLIVKGTPKTPALDQRQAALLGLPPTGHAVAGNDALAQNLFLLPGEDSHDDMLASSDGGVFIGWLDRVECFDAPRVRFRAAARGVRRIADGRLGEPLPDLIWEDSLLHALSNISCLGSETVTWSLGSFAGALSAPALSLADVVGLRADSSSS